MCCQWEQKKKSPLDPSDGGSSLEKKKFNMSDPSLPQHLMAYIHIKQSTSPTEIGTFGLLCMGANRGSGSKVLSSRDTFNIKRLCKACTPCKIEMVTKGATMAAHCVHKNRIRAQLVVVRHASSTGVLALLQVICPTSSFPCVQIVQAT